MQGQKNPIAVRAWNYRVIEFDGADGEPYRSIHEVHYANGKPTHYSDQPAAVTWYPTGDGWEDPRQQIERLTSALDKPVLRAADFSSDDAQTRLTPRA